jgi:hypothetical protein
MKPSVFLSKGVKQSSKGMRNYLAQEIKEYRKMARNGVPEHVLDFHKGYISGLRNQLDNSYMALRELEIERDAWKQLWKDFK